MKYDSSLYGKDAPVSDSGKLTIAISFTPDNGNSTYHKEIVLGAVSSVGFHQVQKELLQLEVEVNEGGLN